MSSCFNCRIIYILTNNTECCTCLENTHDGDNKIDTAVGIDHDDIFALNAIIQEVVRHEVRCMVDVPVCVYRRLLGRIVERFDNASTFRMLLSVGSKNIRDGSAPK